MVKQETKPKAEVKEEAQKDVLNIPELGEEVQVTKQDLYDEELFQETEESGPGADLGSDTPEGEDPAGTSSQHPGYHKGGVKRKRGGARVILQQVVTTTFSPFQDHHIFQKEYSLKSCLKQINKKPLKVQNKEVKMFSMQSL